MKNNLGKIVVVFLLCGTLPAWAQSANQINDSQRDRVPAGDTRLDDLEKASTVLGREIKDAQSQKIGKVKDLAVDLQNGRIVAVIVATGGTLGVDERYMAVPPAQFTCDRNDRVLVLSGEETHFKNGPTFKMAEWDEAVQPKNILNTYNYYGVKPYFYTGDRVAPAHAAEDLANTSKPLGDVQSARKLMGMTAENAQDQKVGKIENLMVDLAPGRVVEVILASGGFLGIDRELSPVPPQAFHVSADHKTLTLDTTREALTGAPHFHTSQWSKANEPDQVAGVYRAYNVAPYFAVDNTKQNVRDRQDNALTPLKQGNSAADVDTTRQIRKQIMAAGNLSINAQNVKIITIDGHVTLRGPVNSEEERRQIVAIAARVTPAVNVDDQLQVKDSANPNSTK